MSKVQTRSLRDVLRQSLAWPECGWLYLDDLTRELAVSEQTLRLHVFRARKAVEALGIPDPASLIERRVATRQMRLGPWDIQLRAMDA